MPLNFSSWLLQKKFNSQVHLSGRPVQSHRIVNPYHAVSIATGSGCCKAVAELKARRFLASDAPSVPLPACNAASCSCRYIHFDDRRTDDDRRVLMQDLRGGRATRERRLGQGRRAND